MNVKTLSITMTILVVLSYGSLVNAEEVVLCINSTDRYVDIVNDKGECTDGEEQMTMKGPEIADLKRMNPVAIFDNNDECDTEGTVTKIGFDKNGNNNLDEDEVKSVKRNCSLKIYEEFDE